MNWNTLTNSVELQKIITQSHQSPQVIFKHSTRCSISSMALSRLERSWKADAHPQSQLFLLDLIQHRDISNQIAAAFGVYHQSPQVLIIYQGKAVYDASHMDISYSEIAKNLLSTAA